MTYLLLFAEFFKTGLFSVGGGMATLPFLYDMAEKYPWFTTEELVNMLAVSESTPGPIGINMATYAGIQAGGIPGGVLATFALVLPSVIIICILAGVLNKFRRNPVVESTFFVLRPVSVGLIAAAGWSVLRLALLNAEALAARQWLQAVSLPALALAIGLLALRLIVPKLHPVVLVLLGAAAGIVLQL